MEKDDIVLDKIEKKDPFKAPENYFEDFFANMIMQLPEHPVEMPKVINLWEKIKPWVYMTAMFAGISLIINLFARESNKRQDIGVYASESFNLSSSNDIDDFYRYYEDALTKIAYDDTIAYFLGYADMEHNYLNKK
jgi:hypothetical protein